MSASSFRRLKWLLVLVVVLVTGASAIRAGEADLAIPDLHVGRFFATPGDPHSGISAWNLLAGGALVICITLGFSLYLRAQIHALPAHKSMLDVAEVIFQTCKTYLIQQGKFLLMLFVLIAVAITYYLVGFGHAAEYELTDREIQELRIQGVPDEVIDKLRPVVGLKVAPKKASTDTAEEEK